MSRAAEELLLSMLLQMVLAVLVVVAGVGGQAGVLGRGCAEAAHGEDLDSGESQLPPYTSAVNAGRRVDLQGILEWTWWLMARFLDRQ